jgi:DNA-binding MarR family transcriptional regulator
MGTQSTNSPTSEQADNAACIQALLAAEGRINGQLAGLYRKYGITGAGFNVLAILAEGDHPLTPHEIGEQRLVTRGTVTGVLDSLEKRELLERKNHPRDRRMLEVFITDAGRELLARILPEQREAEAQLLANLNEGDRKKLHKLLNKVAT